MLAVIIDSFCFAQQMASERGLLQDIPLDIAQLPKSAAIERHICLFNTDIKQCESWLLQASADSSVGINALIPKDVAVFDAWLPYHEYFNAFVLHPYLQCLHSNNLSNIKQFVCSDLLRGRPIFVCTAIGSQKVYTIDPLKVAAEIASWVDSPVILAHAGGAKIVEAFLIADAYPHVFLETSFSLPFWEGSSIEQDIAFAMKKMGAGRWLYGSDAPYCSEALALDAHRRFFDKFKFDQSFSDRVMGLTAKEILSTTR